MIQQKRSTLIKWLVLALLLLFAGMFLLGIGFQRYRSNQAIRKEFQNSSLEWKRELADGMEEEAREIRNQEVIKSLSYISMEREIYFKTSSGEGEARISNDAESLFGCRITMVRDATGETIYQSDIIEPGYYIEHIRLNHNLQPGYYPCTAVLEFYTESDEYVGEAAWKTVVVIMDQSQR